MLHISYRKWKGTGSVASGMLQPAPVHSSRVMLDSPGNRIYEQHPFSWLISSTQKRPSAAASRAQSIGRCESLLCSGTGVYPSNRKPTCPSSTTANLASLQKAPERNKHWQGYDYGQRASRSADGLCCSSAWGSSSWLLFRSLRDTTGCPVLACLS